MTKMVAMPIYGNNLKNLLQSGDALVLGKLPVPGRPTNMDESRTRAYRACSRCGWGCLDIFTLVISLFFLPLSGNTRILSQMAVKPKNLQNSWADCLETWYVAFGELVLWKCDKIMNLG